MKPHWSLARPTALGLVLLGWALRLHQLGRASFWNDEAAVSLVAVTPTLTAAWNVMRTHVTPMPLDYLVAWGLGRGGLQEFYLRFPSVMWGTLTLAVSYRLFRRLSNDRVAWLTVLLLALSPALIHYSQELRFYAALIFFYSLSTWRLLVALQSPRPLHWIGFAIVTSIGAYFHVFVLLAFVNGLIWLLMLGRRNSPGRQPWAYFVASGIGVGLVFLPGYMFFGLQGSKLTASLQQFGPLWVSIGRGLGWLELPYLLSPTWGQAWGGVCFGFGLVGLGACWRSAQRLSMGLGVSGSIQIALVITAAAVNHFFFAYRQILILLPAAYFFAALGSWAMVDWIARRVKSLPGHAIIAGVVVGFVLASLPALADYYSWPKSTARSISTVIATRWSMSDQILVTPAYEERIYRFYWQYVLGRMDMVPALLGVNLEEIPSDAPGGYLIVGTRLTLDEQARISALGYQLLPIPDAPPGWKQQIYAREQK